MKGRKRHGGRRAGRGTRLADHRDYWRVRARARNGRRMIVRWAVAVIQSITWTLDRATPPAGHGGVR